MHSRKTNTNEIIYLLDNEDDTQHTSINLENEIIYLLSGEKTNFSYVDYTINKKNVSKEPACTTKLDAFPKEVLFHIVVGIWKAYEFDLLRIKNRTSRKNPYKEIPLSIKEKIEIEEKSSKLAYKSLLNLRGVNKRFYNFFSELRLEEREEVLKAVKDLLKKTSEEASIVKVKPFFPFEKAGIWALCLCLFLGAITFFCGAALYFSTRDGNAKESNQGLKISTGVLGGITGLVFFICCGFTFFAPKDVKQPEPPRTNADKLSLIIRTHLKDFNLFAKKDDDLGATTQSTDNTLIM